MGLRRQRIRQAKHHQRFSIDAKSAKLTLLNKLPPSAKIPAIFR